MTWNLGGRADMYKQTYIYFKKLDPSVILCHKLNENILCFLLNNFIRCCVHKYRFTVQKRFLIWDIFNVSKVLLL